MILLFFPLFLLPYLVKMIQCYHSCINLTHELAPVTPLFGCFVLGFCVLFCLVGLLLVFVSGLLRLRDSLLDYAQVLYQFTLEAPQLADGHVCVN